MMQADSRNWNLDIVAAVFNESRKHHPHPSYATIHSRTMNFERNETRHTSG
jgi:hypothetical protein